MTLIKRMQLSTPAFFKKVRNFSLMVIAVCATILSAKIAMPGIILQIAGYLSVAGSVAATISQFVTADKTDPEKQG